MGCTGPHGLYTFPGGQVRSGSTETGVRWAREPRAPGVPQPRYSPHSPLVALRQSLHAPRARQSAA